MKNRKQIFWRVLFALVCAMADVLALAHVCNAQTNHYASLTWDAPHSADGFNVYRADCTSTFDSGACPSGSLGTFAKVNAALVASPNYEDHTVQAGGRYIYVVRSVSSLGESGDSNQAGADFNGPAAPTNLQLKIVAVEIPANDPTVMLQTDTPGAVGTIAFLFDPGAALPTDEVHLFDSARNGVRLNFTKGQLAPDDGSLDFFISPEPGKYSIASSVTKSWSGGTKYCVVLTWDGTTQQIYVDGKLETSTPQTQTGGWSPMQPQPPVSAWELSSVVRDAATIASACTRLKSR